MSIEGVEIRTNSVRGPGGQVLSLIGRAAVNKVGSDVAAFMVENVKQEIKSTFSYTILSTIAQYMLIWGDVVVLPGPPFQVCSVDEIRGDMMWVVPQTYDDKMQNTQGARRIQVRRKDCLYFTNTRTMAFYIVDPILQVIECAITNISNSLKNSDGIIKGFLKLGVRAENTKLEGRIRARISEILKGLNDTKGIAPLQLGEEFQELKRDLQLISVDHLQLLQDELLAAFNINRNIVLGTANEQEQIQYRTSVVRGLQRIVQEELKRMYPSAEFTVDAMSILDMQAFIDKGVYNGLLSLNEARAFIGLAPFDGGDIHTSNLNAVPLDALEEVRGAIADEKK